MGQVLPKDASKLTRRKTILCLGKRCAVIQPWLEHCPHSIIVGEANDQNWRD